ncbi:MAG TPA: DUF4097 family beta strand repeat-containing protein [Bacteroidales bacterium]|nr:DUF4097 family beta strand repeat-containing protein [Bacteroidales bacterium]
MKERYLTTFRRTAVLFYFLAAGIVTASAQFTQKRILERTEPAGRETTLEINNKYGKIEITLWNRDSVYIRTEIEAYAPSQSRTDKMLSGISIDFSSSKYLFKAKTSFDQSPGMILESFKGMTSKVINYDSRIEVNYYVKIPDYISIRLDNRYGDVFMENLKGNLFLNLSNGSFKAGNIEGSCELNLDFANATLNEAGTCRIDGSFSELTIKESGAMNINSISSRYETGKVSELTIESRRDKIFTGTVDVFRGNSYFSQIRIDRLTGEADINPKYGNLTITDIDNMFRRIKINSGYNDIYLTFDRSASYNFYLRHTNTFVSLPNEATTEKKPVSEEKKEYITTGTIGRSPGKRQVDIEATRGTISLR